MSESVDILLVDDRQENLLALEGILEPLGHRLVRASSGEAALRHLLAREIAVILLDVQMPGLNGFDTARMIKKRERTSHIPIIFLTALSKEEQYVFEGYSAGAVDYLFKPFQPEILRSKVAAFVDLYLKQRALTAQEKQLRDAEVRELELKHMRELLASEARYKDIIGSAMDAIVAVDPNGVITLFNGSAERMFGCSQAEAVGTDISQYFSAPSGEGTVADRLRGLATRSEQWGAESPQPAPRLISISARTPSGTTFPIEASISTIDSGDAHGFTLIARDVSDRLRHEQAVRDQATSLARQAEELRSLNEELNKRQRDLERAMTSRNRFYASMSHELRTPINAVLGYSTLLLERIYGPLNDKQTEGIQRSQKAARHLLELVNDVLDLSKIEAGKIDLRLQPVSFPELIEDLFVTVRPLADEHGSKLELECTEGPITVVSDPRRVRQILLNLLSNAIKFGQSQPIRVECEHDGRGALVRVIDKGVGVSAEDQERIFQEFVQLGRTQLQDGTGLGLPISRRLAELLSGSLSVESEPGKGSTFTLRLPPEPVSAESTDRDVPMIPVNERGAAPLATSTARTRSASVGERR